jgi:hypothetical protein
MADDRTITTADRARTGERRDPDGSGEGRVWVPDTQERGAPNESEERVALFRDSDAGEFRERWESIQAGFVDEPRRSVEQADNLVDEVVKRLSESFSKERTSLEGQWASGADKVSTEDLRLALRRYRSFFNRLLSI